jgi:hypothetical protein
MTLTPIMVAAFAFGAFALVLLTLLQGMVTWKKGTAFTKTYTRNFGLIVIGTFAVALATSGVASADKSAAYGLLGTIGGYLAASSSPSREESRAAAGSVER